jgi:indole-3-glycerol phosphate synthase
VATYLDRIVAAHRRRAGADGRRLEDLVEAAAAAGPPRPFASAVAAAAVLGLAVIAEFKRRSPVKGALGEEADPAAVARDYAAGGAAALSVLTDEDFFGGSPADLTAARSSSGLPVLRKDFLVSPADVCDARVMGADAVLLIVAALSPAELERLWALARELGLDAVVEVHDEDELTVALRIIEEAGGGLLGVNQRDLETFAVDSGRAARLRPLIPEGVLTVAESGIGGPSDAARLADAGYHAVLVGETLMRAADRAGAVRGLREAAAGPAAAAASGGAGAPGAAVSGGAGAPGRR